MRVRHAEDRFVGTLEDEEASARLAATRRERRGTALLKARNRLCIKRGARNRRDSVTMDQPLLALPPGTPARVILRSREIIIIRARGRRVTPRSEDARVTLGVLEGRL